MSSRREKLIPDYHAEQTAITRRVQTQKQVQQYRDIFPEHQHYTIYSGLAALSVPADVVNEAHQRSLFVLKQVGDVIEVDSAAMRAL